MAVGFPAMHQGVLELSGEKQFLIDLCVQAIESFGWKLVRLEDEDRYMQVATMNGGLALSERILFDVRDNLIAVRSACAFPTQFIDFGKNKANVERLFAEVQRLHGAQKSSPSNT